jgi:uncharacterized flavoprotein (TIGR03862 family)
MENRSLRVAIVGGGPAGLMAAETVCAAGFGVDVYEGKGSVGRKFLLAGKGGLNLTHSEDFDAFVARYGERASEIRRWLTVVDNQFIRDWARGLGVETMIGTSGRVFPADLKAAPLLRRWVKRLRDSGVQFHVNHYCTCASTDGELTFRTPQGMRVVKAAAVIFAMGGGSWPELGSDGAWVEWMKKMPADVAPLEPSNCGFDVDWTKVFAERYAGEPVKSVVVSARDAAGEMRAVQSEFVITAHGVEGSAIYTHSANLRETIVRAGFAEVRLDLAPARDLNRLQDELSRPPGRKSQTEHVRRTTGIEGVKMGLLYEFVPRADMQDALKLAAAIKSLPVRLTRPRPIAEAISSAGGVRFEGLDENLMLRSAPGFFCAGEMIDWEAPTGGYLLTACFASGRIAGQGACAWLNRGG